MAKGTITMFPMSAEDRAKIWGKLLSLLSQIDEETEAAKIAAKASRELICELRAEVARLRKDLQDEVCELRAEVARLRKDLQDEGYDQRTGEARA